jgi:hypothetical protein
VIDPSRPNSDPVPAIVKPADTLADLARQLKALEADDPAQTVAYLDRFRQKGELLLRVKTSLPPGQGMGAWIKANLPYKKRRAQQYMLLAREWPRVKREVEAHRGALVSLRSVLGMIANYQKKRLERKLQRENERNTSEVENEPALSVDEELDAMATGTGEDDPDEDWQEELLDHEKVPLHQRGDNWSEDEARLYPTATPDAADAPVSASPEQAPRVTTPEGNGQSSTVRKPEILCDRCRRVGWRPRCPACEDLNRTGRAAPRNPGPDVPHPDDPKDPYGIRVPKRCRDVLFDPWAPGTLDLLVRLQKELLEPRIMDEMEKRRKRLPHLWADAVKAEVHILADSFNKVIDHFETCRPYAVCPRCKGEGCGEDHHTGVVGKKTYEKLTAKPEGGANE